MKKHNVSVEIETEEESMEFEEKIITKNKKPIYDSFDMPKHTCQKCGSKQSIPSAYDSQDLKDVECYECGKYGFVDELSEIVKEKIEMIKNANTK